MAVSPQKEGLAKAADGGPWALLDAVDHAVLVVDGAGRIAFANASTERLFGHARTTLVGAPLSMLVAAHRRTEEGEHLATLFAAATAGTLDSGLARHSLEGVRKSGEQFAVELTVSATTAAADAAVVVTLREGFVTDQHVREELLRVQTAVATALAAGTSFMDSCRDLVRRTCEGLEWDAGAMWSSDESGKLRCVYFWARPEFESAEFERATHAEEFELGAGLPGRIWISRKPEWIADIGADANFPRTPWAVAAGLRSGFGFPLLSGDEVFATLEFFSCVRREREPVVLDLLGTTGHQLGDLARRVRAEEALRRSEEQSHSILEYALDAVVGMDASGTITAWNQQAEVLFGFTAHEAIGRPLHATIIPDRLRADHISGLRRFLATGEGTLLNKRVEVLAAHRDGHEFPAELAISAFKFKEEEEYRFSAFIRDIAERKRGVEALEQSEARFRTLFASTADAVMLLDETGFFDCNEATVRMFGCRDKAEFCTKSPWDVSPPTQPDGTASSVLASVRIETAMKEGGNRFEWMHRRLDTGESFPAEVLLSPMLLDGRQVLQATVRDISERTRAAAEHERLTEQLRQAQKMDAIGRLAGGIAHDFNNLLSVVLSYSEMAIDGLAADDPLKEDLQEIEKAGRRAAELTGQLLAFSRQQVMQPQIIDLNDSLGKMERMLRRVIGEDVELRTVMCPSLWPVLADPGQIEQIVMNLSVNARDAMPLGGTLTIETSKVELDARFASQYARVKPGPHVLLAVTDTGGGMDEATKARVFEPFYTTKGLGRGTGLGLSTVLGIVQQSHGVIEVESEPGKGATFKVYLPGTTQAQPRVGPTLSIAPAPRGEETILVAEDEEQLRQLIGGILRRKGYTVLMAGGAAEALRLAALHPGRIDLLLTDVVMPGQNGRELAEQLKSTRPDTAVLFMSGYTGDVIADRGVLDAGTQFLQKPVTPDALLSRVREALEPLNS